MADLKQDRSRTCRPGSSPQRRLAGLRRDRAQPDPGRRLLASVPRQATTGTIRDQLINIPARIATSARRTILHLPTDWPWEHPWQSLCTACGPPAIAN